MLILNASMWRIPILFVPGFMHLIFCTLCTVHSRELHFLNHTAFAMTLCGNGGVTIFYIIIVEFECLDKCLVHACIN